MRTSFQTFHSGATEKTTKKENTLLPMLRHVLLASVVSRRNQANMCRRRNRHGPIRTADANSISADPSVGRVPRVRSGRGVRREHHSESFIAKQRKTIRRDSSGNTSRSTRTRRRYKEAAWLQKALSVHSRRDDHERCLLTYVPSCNLKHLLRE